jgi:hypothetical protein
MFGAVKRGGLSTTACAFALGAAACATSGAKQGGATICNGDLCATIVERELSNKIVVDVKAPAGASLHNAWVAEPGSGACRGGRALNAATTDAGVHLNGPLLLPPSSRLTLTFTSKLSTGVSLDLDVRSPGGMTCLRVPFTAAASDGGRGGEKG